MATVGGGRERRREATRGVGGGTVGAAPSPAPCRGRRRSPPRASATAPGPERPDGRPGGLHPHGEPRSAWARTAPATHRRSSLTSDWWASFTAGTTRVSNPFRSPSFHTSASATDQKTAFALGIPTQIIPFQRSLGHSVFPFRALGSRRVRPAVLLGRVEGAGGTPPTYPLRPM